MEILTLALLICISEKIWAWAHLNLFHVDPSNRFSWLQLEIQNDFLKPFLEAFVCGLSFQEATVTLPKQVSIKIPKWCLATRECGISKWKSSFLNTPTYKLVINKSQKDSGSWGPKANHDLQLSSCLKARYYQRGKKWWHTYLSSSSAQPFELTSWLVRGHNFNRFFIIIILILSNIRLYHDEMQNCLRKHK